MEALCKVYTPGKPFFKHSATSLRGKIDYQVFIDLCFYLYFWILHYLFNSNILSCALCCCSHLSVPFKFRIDMRKL